MRCRSVWVCVALPCPLLPARCWAVFWRSILGEGEEEFPSVVRVVVSVGCGVREDVLTESCHDLGASSAALRGDVSCCGRGGQYVLPFCGSDGVVVGLGQVDRGVVRRAELLVDVCVIGVGGEVALVGLVGISGLLCCGLRWLLSLGLSPSSVLSSGGLKGLRVLGVVAVRGVHGDVLGAGVRRERVIVVCSSVLVCVSYCFSD